MISSILAALTSLFATSFPGAWGALASALANHLWQSTLFAAVAALLTFALRNNRAPVRYWLWFAASAKFLVPFSLLIALGTHLAWLHPTARPTAAANTATYFVMQEVGQPFDLALLPTPAPQPTPSRTARLRAALGGSFFPAALAAIWLAGFLFILTRWIFRWLKIAAVLRRAPTLTQGREADALQPITRLAGLTRPIALKSLPIAIEPGIFGLFRPVLLWPEGISAHLDDAQLASVLAHEVSHIRRHDNLTAALHMAVEAVFWFHPVVWWLQTRLVAERETACDEDVLTLLGPTSTSARAYAESILKVCEYSIVSPLPCISGVTGADLRRRIAAIVNARALARISWPKKLLLAAAAISVLAAPLVLGMMNKIPIYGQILHSDGPLPSFELATIRPMEISGVAAPSGIDPSKIVHAQEVRITNVPFSDQVDNTMTAKMLIADAYHLPTFSTAQIVGGSDWADKAMYQIKAKIGDSQYAALLKMPSAQQQKQVRLMEQSLLAERFRLGIHFETRSLPVYALQVAKGGPKLTPAKPDSAAAEPADSAPPTRPVTMSLTSKGNGFEIKGKAVSPAQLILLLQQQPEVGNRLMVDKTGLTAKYDLTLDWTRDLTAAADAGPAPTDAAPSLFTALKEQLGLELVETKAPIEVLVIDHIERPSLDGAEVSPTTTLVPAASAQENPAQTAIFAKPWRFEVVSIRRNTRGGQQKAGQATADGYRQENLFLLLPILTAYVPQAGGGAFYTEDAIVGAPAWLTGDDDHYDIDAKVSPADLADWRNPAKQPAMLRSMLQQMLADRLKLVVHRDTKEAPVYSLVVGKSGPKFKETDPSQPHPGALQFPGGGQLTVERKDDLSIRHYWGLSVGQIAATLLNGTGRQVQDNTSLNGKYDFTISMPISDSVSSDAGPGTASDPKSLAFSAAEQLGLKLEPAKGQVETLVIDHIERPSEN